MFGGAFRWIALALLGVGALGTPRAEGGAGGAADPVALAAPAGPDTAAVRHLLSRTTWGVGAADVERAVRIGPAAWLEEQLHPERIDDSVLEARIASRYPAAALDAAALYERYPPPQLLRRGAEPGRGDTVTVPTRASLQALYREAGVMPPGRMLADLAAAKLERAVTSERQLEDVMTDFWFNHFNVFWAKGADRWLVADYEREAIRPHVFGRFEDLLVATASHPAMLFYLDNWTNVAPDSLRPADPRLERLRSLPAGIRRRVLERRGLDEDRIQRVEAALENGTGRGRGINENYARELLELHTLGVDGGYTQEDVIEVARVFTGWTFGAERRGRPGPAAGLEAFRAGYAFRPELHDPTDKTVLGVEIRGRAGAAGREEGLEVLAMLARHPATARHVATKLAVAFAADDPPQALVDELARTFLETDGDLREVTRTLFTSERFLDPALHAAKLKTPFELVASAYRATGSQVLPSRALLETLSGMGEAPYLAQAPTGYPDRAEEWSSSGALLQRVNLALALAAGDGGGPGRDNVRRAADDRELAAAVVAHVLPGADVPALAAGIAVELSRVPDADADERRALALGLALGSPEFQAR